MPDFTSLLHKDMEEIKKPPAWPTGMYPGRILRYEPGESSQKKTPYMRFTAGVTGFPENLDASETAGLDLEGKTFRCDYYLTEDALFRLKDLMAGLGFTGFLDEALPQSVGSEVLIDLTQELNQQTNEIFNRVNRLLSPSAA